MERILLGYDASDGADAALDWVTDRALRRQARVEVVLITNPFLQDQPRAEEDLARAEQRLRTANPALPVEATRIDGLMPRALTDAAEDADILVIGVDNGHSIREALHGWMSLRVSAMATVPTCIVPSGWTETSGPVTVGLATDRSSDAALTFAAAEAAAAGETLRIVHAWSGPILPTGAPAAAAATASAPRAVRAQHEQLMHETIERLQRDFSGLAVDQVLIHDNAVSVLSKAAGDSSLLVLGTHGRGLLAGGFFGSVGQDLIGRLDVPVAVVPSGR
ncbi:nucleotide-binding universal stress UspA family protein [Microbacterium sp. SLBN-154]|uniref:universal stress protein n=1 Tax=Microbacterium sp. SLBN-154 TaxID=2768458 RepID=UPI00117207CB|nr:universal stress protein [Microbacterium sp. SLBN-154]TQK18843.1 nucleotide-binding universal stress UspA family protein [Microbacterium sp. SLBN-154]